ncbi:hypothetical protein [Coleofasciculus sp. FACHB-501]|uniref:hypothetical protein n=1 Tax=Cyanophyceae TaxID=3028117 RepID=UPI00168816F7|nr:hypothetical protein [Coleofasciculus sp. FACHB-501]MBD1838389.1 hypothetical protein [Coleofasciculus sp. FACHB-501]
MIAHPEALDVIGVTPKTLMPSGSEGKILAEQQNKGAKKLRGMVLSNTLTWRSDRTHPPRRPSQKAASAGISIFGFPHSSPECFSCTKR